MIGGDGDLRLRGTVVANYYCRLIIWFSGPFAGCVTGGARDNAGCTDLERSDRSDC